MDITEEGIPIKENSMAVHFMCKICGREHRSPLLLGNRESFESGVQSAKSWPCLSTGRSASYQKKDMRWK
jgi:hypothetical protein